MFRVTDVVPWTMRSLYLIDYIVSILLVNANYKINSGHTSAIMAFSNYIFFSTFSSDCVCEPTGHVVSIYSIAIVFGVKMFNMDRFRWGLKF